MALGGVLVTARTYVRLQHRTTCAKSLSWWIVGGGGFTPPPPPRSCPRARSVLRAYAVAELAALDANINVEMDPVDESRIRQRIREDGLR